MSNWPEWTSPSGDIRVVNAYCLAVLKTLEDCSVDAIVTDPPYGLTANKKGGSGVASVNLDSPAGRSKISTGNGAGGFMGLKWDAGVPNIDVWEECLRVLKPGGHLLAFAGTRTQHKMATNIEEAGFEIRDMIAWVYGSGFPRSLDVSKAIDKAAGAEREVVATSNKGSGPQSIKLDNHGEGDTGIGYMDGSGKVFEITAPATDAAKQWQGWGTALKPALEPITVARKPLVGTVAENVQEYGTGAINVDGCRVPATGEIIEQSGKTVDIARGKCAEGYDRPNATMFRTGKPKERGGPAVDAGRWPANFIHDGSEEVLHNFPQTTSGKQSANGHTRNSDKHRNAYAKFEGQKCEGDVLYGDTGSAARFFYCAKASKKERGEGNTHPTVKPLALMEYLCKLVTPPGGTIVDPYTGSGTTALAANKNGFKFIGAENDEKSFAIAVNRIRTFPPAPLPPTTPTLVQPMLFFE